MSLRRFRGKERKKRHSLPKRRETKGRRGTAGDSRAHRRKKGRKEESLALFGGKRKEVKGREKKAGRDVHLYAG